METDERAALMSEKLTAARLAHQEYEDLAEADIRDRCRGLSEEEFGRLCADLTARWLGADVTETAHQGGHTIARLRGRSPERANSTIIMIAALEQASFPRQEGKSSAESAVALHGQSTDGWVVMCSPEEFTREDWEVTERIRHQKTVMLLGGTQLAESMRHHGPGGTEVENLRFVKADNNRLPPISHDETRRQERHGGDGAGG